ncbi:hypothetical protein Tco_1094756 [Tanacetum coccineum]|uniref:Uncharacterized protein n=1 Tax=Tanacetum coccineum TaxID=301880 RepID=A0ABQ5IGL9_9ASTR
MKKAAEETKLLAMSRPEVIKVVQEEAEKIGLDPRKIASAKEELNRRRAEEYMWTMINRIKPEPITNVRIHPKTKPIVASVFRNNDKRNFDVHQPFKFSDFGITELDELAPEQASSQTSGRKRKHMEQELEVKVHGLDCNRSLPEGISFVNYMVIEEPEYGIFFIDTEENARFSLKLRKMIADHPDQDKLKSKKVKLEALGYHVVPDYQSYDDLYDQINVDMLQFLSDVSQVCGYSLSLPGTRATHSVNVGAKHKGIENATVWEGTNFR